MTMLCARCGGAPAHITVDGDPLCDGHRAEWLSAEIAAQAGEAGTAETVKQGSVHEHASATPMRPKTVALSIILKTAGESLSDLLPLAGRVG
jgi:hypothetical protein